MQGQTSAFHTRYHTGLTASLTLQYNQLRSRFVNCCISRILLCSIFLWLHFHCHPIHPIHPSIHTYTYPHIHIFITPSLHHPLPALANLPKKRLPLARFPIAQILLYSTTTYRPNASITKHQRGITAPRYLPHTPEDLDLHTHIIRNSIPRGPSKPKRRQGLNLRHRWRFEQTLFATSAFRTIDRNHGGHKCAGGSRSHE